MIRRALGAFAALLWLVPLAASAQSISGGGSGGFTPGSAIDCSSVASLCLNLQNPVGTTVFSVDKSGVVIAGASASRPLGGVGTIIISGGFSGYGLGFNGNGEITSWINGSPESTMGNGFSTNNNVGTLVFGTAHDLVLARDGANTLALRNGTNAQTFNVYNTYTDGSNYERGTFGFSSNKLVAGTQATGTGSLRAFELVGGGGLFLNGSGADNWLVSTSGHFLAVTDNTYDIGQSGANRPRNVYVGGQITASGVVSSFSAVQTGTAALAGVGACGAGTKGNRWMVNDSTVAASGNFGTAVTGGGSNTVPVYCDGTSWKIGRADLSPANDNLPPELRKQAGELWSAFG